MALIDQLTREFARLPGVGPKTAVRLVYHMLKRPREDSLRLSAAIRDVAERVGPCSTCGNFTESEECDVCVSPRREADVLCVVEEAFEVGAIERTGVFQGRYHVLGGRLSPLDGIGPEQLSIAALLERVKPSGGRDQIKEIIVATNSSVEGEATAVYLEDLIRPLGIRVTRLARGIPVGSDLEYVDGSTIAEALAGRREMGRG
jgi:recombination protein RecR